MKKLILLALTLITPMSYAEELNLICRGIETNNNKNPHQREIQLTINTSNNTILHYPSILSQIHELGESRNSYSVNLTVDNFTYKIYENYTIRSTGAQRHAFFDISRHDGSAKKTSIFIHENQKLDESSFIGRCEIFQGQLF